MSQEKSNNSGVKGEGEGEAEGEVVIRRATREDAPVILRLIQELAEFEGVPDGPQITTDELIRDGFECDSPWYFVLLAECGGSVVGQAMVSRAYSSWTGRAAYLEDLYVVPKARRQGIATKLLVHLCQICASEGMTRLDWHVLEDNSAAWALYSRLGARCLRRTERRAALRLDEHRIQHIAKHSQF